MIRDAGDLIRMIRRAASDAVATIRTPFKSTADPSYASGNPKTQRPGEASAANKTKKILIPYAVKRPAASYAIIEIPVGNDTVVAAIGDATQGIDCDTWMGIPWVKPGSTDTLQSANTERSTTNATFTEVKRFNLSFPGRYRVAMELARSGNTTEAKLQLLLLDGATWIDVSSTTQSVSNYPTFSSVAIDMNVTANSPGMILRVVLRNTVGGVGNDAYIRNVAVRYSQATAPPTLYSATITD